MLGSADLVAFVPSYDLARSRAFYEGVLGLTVLEENPIALVVDANGTILRITAVADFTPHPFTTLGWEVPDIEAAVRGLVGRGVTFQRFDGMEQDDLGIWQTPGPARVAWFQDPDGNLLSVGAGS
jgi:catechol 2,3-dioxygenase-like lactoylglutathione lyase family enzyme